MGDLQRRFLGIPGGTNISQLTLKCRLYATTLFCKAWKMSCLVFSGSHTFLQGQKHFLAPKMEAIKSLKSRDTQFGILRKLV